MSGKVHFDAFIRKSFYTQTPFKDAQVLNDILIQALKSTNIPRPAIYNQWYSPAWQQSGATGATLEGNQTKQYVTAHRSRQTTLLYARQDISGLRTYSPGAVKEVSHGDLSLELQHYLKIRRNLGYDWARQACLKQFVSFMEMWLALHLNCFWNGNRTLGKPLSTPFPGGITGWKDLARRVIESQAYAFHRFVRRPLPCIQKKSGCLCHQEKQRLMRLATHHDKPPLQTRCADIFRALATQRGLYRHIESVSPIF